MDTSPPAPPPRPGPGPARRPPSRELADLLELAGGVVAGYGPGQLAEDAAELLGGDPAAWARELRRELDPAPWAIDGARRVAAFLQATGHRPTDPLPDPGPFRPRPQ